MAKTKIARIIAKAKNMMERSTDPIHDVRHAERVVQNVKRLSEDLKLNQEQRHALILAAWWHDVSRTFTKKPSLVWMPLLDDLLSAFTLWIETIRHGMFGSVVGMATRLIFCKSLGTGAILTHVLLQKKNRILLDVLKDADTLDMLHIERVEQVCSLVDRSSLYHLGYRVHCWWFLTSHQLEMRTTAAKKYFIVMMREFLTWLKKHHVYTWHVQHYGYMWVQEKMQALEKRLYLLEKEFVTT